ncbi:MAG: hypothetical protein NZM38_09190 [Cytophagales bacterium]|nr:hypothetical protein [Cytophagales bacterium]MDW8384933.1 hypothetical protein [Flammeovirgaceae bacterium]
MQTKVKERAQQITFVIGRSYMNLAVMASSVVIWIILRSFGISELLQLGVVSSVLMFFTKTR